MTRSALTLAEAISEYGRDAYLLTVGKDGPHTTPVSIELGDNLISCTIGPSAARNIANEPNVSLFWPPPVAGGYAMFVNGIATAHAVPNGVAMANISPTKSVFHRRGPKPPDSTSACDSDCRRISG